MCKVVLYAAAKKVEEGTVETKEAVDEVAAQMEADEKAGPRKKAGEEAAPPTTRETSRRHLWGIARSTVRALPKTKRGATKYANLRFVSRAVV